LSRRNGESTGSPSVGCAAKNSNRTDFDPWAEVVAPERLGCAATAGTIEAQSFSDVLGDLAVLFALIAATLLSAVFLVAVFLGAGVVGAGVVDAAFERAGVVDAGFSAGLLGAGLLGAGLLGAGLLGAGLLGAAFLGAAFGVVVESFCAGLFFMVPPSSNLHPAG
jgi:hypothetical protein